MTQAVFAARMDVEEVEVYHFFSWAAVNIWYFLGLFFQKTKFQKKGSQAYFECMKSDFKIMLRECLSIQSLCLSIYLLQII